MEAIRLVLLHETLFPVVTQYQHGLFLAFLPHYRVWAAANRRWQALLEENGGCRGTQAAMAPGCTCLYTASELCLSTLSGPTRCLEHEMAYHCHVAIRSGNSDALAGWLAYAPALATPFAVTCASRYNSLACLAQLLHLVPDAAVPHEALEYAVEAGAEAALDLLYPRISADRLVADYSVGLLDLAASVGHLHIVKRLHAMTYPRGCTTRAIDDASANGHIATVEFLLAHRQEGCTSAALDGAAAGGHEAIVRALHAAGAPATEHALEMAAGRGHETVVRFLVANRREGRRAYAMDDAAKNGHEAIVMLLHAASFGCTHRAMNNAALNGHLAVVRFLHEHRTEGCTTFAMDWAAAKGFLEVVMFLHEHRSEGCTTKAMDGAAKAGHAAVVHFLHSQRTEGCTTEAVDCAAANGHVDVVDFLVTHRSEGFTPRALRDAAVRGHACIALRLLAAFPGLRHGSSAEFSKAEALLV
ncbi:hypothetical protein ACHHYP_15973 [Achlya hypogyna]|uniref:Ankyrin repeat protein n=1 Tax=Achlya hypogyna TaxID=1202772 RepID=A0A1V9Y9V3_ACHHY|nr:hypothetical protein ACHHYP_15973 [Achlya hypogyna]